MARVELEPLVDTANVYVGVELEHIRIWQLVTMSGRFVLYMDAFPYKMKTKMAMSLYYVVW